MVSHLFFYQLMFLGLLWLCVMLHYEQLPENLRRKGYTPIIGKSRGVTWGACIFVVVYSGDPHHADPQTALL